MTREPLPELAHQLSLPGLPGKCPHCGSSKVDLDALHDDESEDLEADRWRCRACDRVWWQLSRP